MEGNAAKHKGLSALVYILGEMGHEGMVESTCALTMYHAIRFTLHPIGSNMSDSDTTPKLPMVSVGENVINDR